MITPAPSTKSVPSQKDITRRNFMKKTALSAGGVTLLGQGVGFALPSSWFCNAACTGWVANIPTQWYFSTDGDGQMIYFQLGTCMCSNGHRFGPTATGLVGHEPVLNATAWGPDPMKAGHIPGGCGAHH